MIRSLIRKNIRNLRPYQAEEIACRVKLDANESPYDFPDALSAVKPLRTNRYPDPEAKAVRSVLAKMWGVRSENILHGNGSDELIFYLISVFGGPVLFPVPTFSMYGIIGTILDQKTIGVPLDETFQLDEAALIRSIRHERPRIIFLSSPNNPTGNSFAPNVMLKILQSSKGIVVIDEAYQPFSSRKSFVPYLTSYSHLVIMKTLSKIGLAALRTGFIIAGKEIIREVNKVRLPFNVNSLSQTVALRALRNSERLRHSVSAVVREREKLFSRLQGLEGVQPFPSDANFILFRVKRAGRVYELLLERGVLVRNLSRTVRDCLRVTIGLPEENAFFFNTLKKVIRG